MALSGKQNGSFGRFADRQQSRFNEGEGIYADAARRVEEAYMEGKLSNRRYRRWVNDRLLREMAPPMDAKEIGGLFAPPPWGERNYQTPLEHLTDAETDPKVLIAWEPFRNNVDMDFQAKFLSQLQISSSYGSKDAAMNAWRAVDRHARLALRRNSDSPLLEILEEKVLQFLSEADVDDRKLVLEVGAPQHRLLLHGLSQFHGLVSQSMQPSQVHITKRSSCQARGNLKLRQFLQEVRRTSVAA